MADYILWGMVIISGITMVFYYLKNKSKFKSLIIGTFSGAAALLLVHYLGGYIGVILPLSAISIATSLILGVPGVIMLIIINFIV